MAAIHLHTINICAILSGATRLSGYQISTSDTLKRNKDSHMPQEQQQKKECSICYDELCSDNSLEYQTLNNSMEWYPAYFCTDCTSVLQATQFQKYCSDLQATLCAREQRALLARGPPINLHDRNGFPEAGDGEISKLRQASNKQVSFSESISLRVFSKLVVFRRFLQN